MATQQFKLQNKQTQNGCAPGTPPPSTDTEPCEGTITGTIRMECCCPRLYSQTFILSLGPQSEASLQTFIQNTVNAYEQAGYVVLGHSIVDTGATWMLGLSVAWYA